MLRFKQEAIVYQMQPWHQLVLNLQAGAIEPKRLRGAAFNEDEMLPIFIQNQLGIPLFYTYIARAVWLYQIGDYAQSLQDVRLAKPLEESAPVTPAYAYRYFYESLACLALGETSGKQSNGRNTVLKTISIAMI
jgi:hypothetical protein